MKLGIYTEKPKSGKGRLAWERFEQEKGYPPYSVSYSPNYQYEFKGWVCEWFGPEVALPACIQNDPHTFYLSSAL